MCVCVCLWPTEIAHTCVCVCVCVCVWVGVRPVFKGLELKMAGSSLEKFVYFYVFSLLGGKSDLCHTLWTTVAGLGLAGSPTPFERHTPCFASDMPKSTDSRASSGPGNNNTVVSRSETTCHHNNPRVSVPQFKQHRRDILVHYCRTLCWIHRTFHCFCVSACVRLPQCSNPG